MYDLYVLCVLCVESLNKIQFKSIQFYPLAKSPGHRGNGTYHETKQRLEQHVCEVEL